MIDRGLSCGPAAIVVGSERPAAGVLYLVPIFAWDSGYMVLFSDAPVDPEDARSSLVCLHCLVEEHPELGRGLDLARAHGSADFDVEAGEWYWSGTAA